MPTAAVQGTHGCLMLLAQVLQNHQTWAWTTLKYYDILISCCLPFRFIHSCAYSVHSRDGRCLWQAFLQLVRFPDSALRFLLQVLECRKSGNATSQANSFHFFSKKCSNQTVARQSKIATKCFQIATAAWESRDWSSSASRALRWRSWLESLLCLRSLGRS